MEFTAYAVYAALLGAGLAAGFGLGLLRSDRSGRRARELAARLETANKERERAQGELQAAREKLGKLQDDYDAYRGLVTDHFVGASDRLREFTVQYRAVYQHLAEGASALCKDGFPGLEGSFEALGLRPGDGDDPPAEAEAETSTASGEPSEPGEDER